MKKWLFLSIFLALIPHAAHADYYIYLPVSMRASTGIHAVNIGYEDQFWGQNIPVAGATCKDALNASGGTLVMWAVMGPECGYMQRVWKETIVYPPHDEGLRLIIFEAKDDQLWTFHMTDSTKETVCTDLVNMREVGVIRGLWMAIDVDGTEYKVNCK
jgi:hypothetical protein